MKLLIFFFSVTANESSEKGLEKPNEVNAAGKLRLITKTGPREDSCPSATGLTAGRWRREAAITVSTLHPSSFISEVPGGRTGDGLEVGGVPTAPVPPVPSSLPPTSQSPGRTVTKTQGNLCFSALPSPRLLWICGAVQRGAERRLAADCDLCGGWLWFRSHELVEERRWIRGVTGGDNLITALLPSFHLHLQHLLVRWLLRQLRVYKEIPNLGGKASFSSKTIAHHANPLTAPRGGGA